MGLHVPLYVKYHAHWAIINVKNGESSRRRACDVNAVSGVHENLRELIADHIQPLAIIRFVSNLTDIQSLGIR